MTLLSLQVLSVKAQNILPKYLKSIKWKVKSQKVATRSSSTPVLTGTPGLTARRFWIARRFWRAHRFWLAHRFGLAPWYFENLMMKFSNNIFRFEDFLMKYSNLIFKKYPKSSREKSAALIPIFHDFVPKVSPSSVHVLLPYLIPELPWLVSFKCQKEIQELDVIGWWISPISQTVQQAGESG